MKSTISFSGLVLFLLFIAMALFAAPAFAQENVNFEDMGFQGEVEGYEILEPGTRPPETDEFGIKDYNYTWISACQFSQHYTVSTQKLGIIDWVPGYYGRATNTGPYFTAAFNLPTGVDIYSIMLYLHDSHATNDIYGWYWRHNTATNTTTQLKAFNTTGTPGYTIISFDPYPNSIFDNYNTYIIRLRLDAENTPSLSFRGVRIRYLRRISPAPATATFPDVPIGSTHFRTVEALAASGITVGYSDGTYRPQNFVTREEMATFLSRALGLHHKDPN